EGGDRLDLAAVGVEHDDVGLHLVEAAGAGGVALRRRRQAVGAGGDDGLVLQRAVGVAVGDGLGAAAVGVDDGDVGARDIERAVAVDVALRRGRQAIG